MSSKTSTRSGWLDSVPDNWSVVPSKAAFIERRQRSKPDDQHLTPSQKLGVLPQEDYMRVTGTKVVLNLSGQDNMKHVEPDDFIIHLRSFQGGIERSTVKGKVSMAYTVLTPRSDRVQSDYFRWLLKADAFVQELQSTTDQLRDGQSIKYATFAKIRLPLPPIDEQRAIADYLDHEAAQIDALVAKQEELIELLRERRRAEIVSTIDGMDTNRASLRHFTRVVSGSGFPVEAQGQVGLEFPFFKVKDLRSADGSGLLSPPGDSISRETARSLRAAIIPRGSLVFAKVGAALLLGRVGALPVDACIDNNMSALIFESSFNLAFARYLMLTFDFRRFVQPGPVPSLNMDGLREFHVPVPEMRRQIEVATRLDEQISRFDTLIEKAEEHIALAKERRAALITAAVTGQIDVRKARKAS